MRLEGVRRDREWRRRVNGNGSIATCRAARRANHKRTWCGAEHDEVAIVGTRRIRICRGSAHAREGNELVDRQYHAGSYEDRGSTVAIGDGPVRRRKNGQYFG